MDKVLNNGPLTYTGKVQPEQGERDEQDHLLSPYLPDARLVEAVNLAIHLKRPLLIKGEPGCGKTRLAGAVAYELGLPSVVWYVKSTSQARDGLYTYDAVGRLRDAQIAAAGRFGAEDIRHIAEPGLYVRWGPVGRAFQNDRRTVILIDEIDKADIDFPNDLLLELDEQRFFVEETGQEISAKHPPIVFITSNDEKDLPDAFLRRCLFLYVTFPGAEQLFEIVSAHFPTVSPSLVEAAISRFLELREEMYQDKGHAGKKVSTSELIDWFEVLRCYPQDDVMAKLEGELPFAGVLLKSWDDHHRYLTRR
jgi:MoxR-like ATPase